jgi:hypothetical protein
MDRTIEVKMHSNIPKVEFSPEVKTGDYVHEDRLFETNNGFSHNMRVGGKYKPNVIPMSPGAKGKSPSKISVKQFLPPNETVRVNMNVSATEDFKYEDSQADVFSNRDRITVYSNNNPFQTANVPS